MRVELLFELQKKELPKDNKSIWISFLKNVLSSCNGGKYYDRYFSGSKCKAYTYSVVFSKAIFSKEVIELDQTQVKMIFSADDRDVYKRQRLWCRLRHKATGHLGCRGSRCEMSR